MLLKEIRKYKENRSVLHHSVEELPHLNEDLTTGGLTQQVPLTNEETADRLKEITHFEIFYRPKHFRKLIKQVNYSGCGYDLLNNSERPSKIHQAQTTKTTLISEVQKNQRKT